jgi:membrane-associated protease RseP (regulator of RpoE activity)
MSRLRIGILGLATRAIVAGFAAGGGALAQSQGAATPNPQSQASGVAWVGLSLVDLNEKVAARIGVSETVGVAIAQVITKSPAADAGLQTGDIVTSFDGRTIANAAELVAAVKAKKVGDRIAFAVSRKGASVLVTVTAGEMPSTPQPSQRGGAFSNITPGTPGLGKGGFGRGFMAPGGFGFGGLLDGLKDIPAADLFSHLFGWQFKFTDKDGKPVTVRSIPGTVVSAARDSLVIKPNDSSESAGPFEITSDTKVQLSGTAAVESLKAGDRVVVVTADGKTALSVTQAAAGLPPDGSGNRRIPGTVVSVAKDSITIRPNDSSQGGGPFAITGDTKVQLPGGAAVDSLKVGDQVVVVTSDGKTAFSVVQGAAESPPNGLGHRRNLMNGPKDRLPKQAPSRGNIAPSGTSS